jgi:glucose/arabinose dehydrogenase
LLALLLAACGGGGNSGTGSPDLSPGTISLGLQQININLSFPVFATAPTNDANRLFIVEKNGAIKILDLNTLQLRPTPFLTVTGISTSGEQGLLGLAFHPNFAQNGFFYIYVSNASGDSEIRRYTVSANPDVADPTSTLITTISQLMPDGMTRFTNHKAGWIGFGQDGFLYVALGDGGSGGDPGENAENRNSLLGKILRLDVDSPDAFPTDPTRNYAIPAGNPFEGATPGADEIWAYGLRNPWRPSFDRGTGDFYIADVGQGAREEVNVATQVNGGGAGLNFGWDIMEGSLCFEPANCSSAGLTLPLVEYDHGQGCSITGGYVYRGNAVQALQGTYFYGDFCAGFVRSFKLVNALATEQTSWPSLSVAPGNITSFGEDAAGELYIMTSGGGLFRIVPN